MQLPPVSKQLDKLFDNPALVGELPEGELAALKAALTGHGDAGDPRLAAFAAMLEELLASVPAVDGATVQLDQALADEPLLLAPLAGDAMPALTLSPAWTPDGNRLPPGGQALPLLPERGTQSLQATIQRLWLDAGMAGGEPRAAGAALIEGGNAAIGGERHSGSERLLAFAPALSEALPPGLSTSGAIGSTTTLLAGLATGTGAGEAGLPGGGALARPPAHPAWGQGLAERVSWLAREGLRGADIALNPPRLGPLGIRLRLEGDQVSVNFTSHSAQVREAVEQALPRLRELLAEGGLELADTRVGDPGSAAGDGGDEDADSSSAQARGEATDDRPAADGRDDPDGDSRRGRGLVDLYA